MLSGVKKESIHAEENYCFRGKIYYQVPRDRFRGHRKFSYKGIIR